MKLVIFGASGRTGKPLTEQALAAGHTVTALVRNRAKLGLEDAQLTVIEGDIMNPADVEKAITGADVVLNTIGHVKGSAPDLQMRAIENILNAMQKHNVQRLITLTGAGVQMPEDQPKLVDHIFRTLLKLTARRVYEDSMAYVERVRQSNVDWTIVRAPRLINAPHTGKVEVGHVGDANMTTQISRADVADFMLKAAEQGAFVQKTPMISA